MRAWEITGSFGLENLTLVERDAAAPGPGEVAVRVHAASLNYRDLMMVRGVYNPRQPLPLVPLSDAAGEVTAVGPGVRRLRAGDRVMGLFAQGWAAGEPTRDALSTTLGGPLPGVLAEQVILREEGCVKVPEHLDFVEASTLPCAAVTAWSALEQAGLVPGQTVLVQGTGGVSLFGLALAKLFGARVVVTSKSDEKLARARALGADATINYAREPEWGKAARAHAGPHGVDVILEVGGGGTLAQSLRAVRPGGTVAIIGVLAGPSADASLLPVLMQNVRLQGVIVGSRERFERMNAAIAHHRLRPIVDRVFALEDARAAFEHLASGAHFGKVCIRVAP